MNSFFELKQTPTFARNSSGHLWAALDGKRRLTIKSFNHNAYLDIREYFAKDGMQLPTKRGVTLTMDEWKALSAHVADLDSHVATMFKAIKDSTASLKPIKLQITDRLTVSVVVQRSSLNFPVVRVILEKTKTNNQAASAKPETEVEARNAELTLHPDTWRVLFGLWHADVDAAFKMVHAECAAERSKILYQSDDTVFKSIQNLSV